MKTVKSFSCGTTLCQLYQPLFKDAPPIIFARKAIRWVLASSSFHDLALVVSLSNTLAPQMPVEVERRSTCSFLRTEKSLSSTVPCIIKRLTITGFVWPLFRRVLCFSRTGARKGRNKNKTKVNSHSVDSLDSLLL